MEKHENFDNNLSQPEKINDQERVILTQLLEIAKRVHHIDELFLWLAHSLVQGFGVQVAQFWAMQANRTGQLSPELRSITCENPALPVGIVFNPHVAAVVEYVLSRRYSSAPQAVESLFSYPLTILLKRRGLNYCANYFLSADMLLPPAYSADSDEKVPTPLEMTLFIFSRWLPRQNVLSAMNRLLEQALLTARGYGLLLSTVPKESSSLTVPDHSSSPVLSECIAYRIEDATSNPIAASAAISDKQARRLYAAMNGRRNVGELTIITQLSREEVYTALEMLLAQHRIELCEPGGQRVESLHFFQQR